MKGHVFRQCAREADSARLRGEGMEAEREREIERDREIERMERHA